MSITDDTRVAVALRDGGRVVVRPVRLEDRALLLTGFERLGEESRYRRFLAPLSELTDDVVKVPHRRRPPRHEAFAAIYPATADAFGVARVVVYAGLMRDEYPPVRLDL